MKTWNCFIVRCCVLVHFTTLSQWKNLSRHNLLTRNPNFPKILVLPFYPTHTPFVLGFTPSPPFPFKNSPPLKFKNQVQMIFVLTKMTNLSRVIVVMQSNWWFSLWMIWNQRHWCLLKRSKTLSSVTTTNTPILLFHNYVGSFLWFGGHYIFCLCNKNVSQDLPSIHGTTLTPTHYL